MTMNDFHPGSRMNRAKAKATSSVKDGFEAASAGAEWALSTASGKMSLARNNLAPSVKEGIETARNKANDLKKVVVDYTREEPVKAILITAVVGVVLMGLIVAIARSDD